MFRWIAKRPVVAHLADGDLVLRRGTIVLRDTDSPMQDRVRFIVAATGQECHMDSDHFMLHFERA
jgi:hypothetical protein